MTERQSLVTINGVDYEVDPTSYEEWFGSESAREQYIVGTSRLGKSLEPYLLEWIMDNWSAGEGWDHLDPTPGHPSQRGWSGARTILEPPGADITIPGQLRPGFLMQNSLADAATATAGPYLVPADGNLWVVYSDATTTTTKYTSDLASWNDVADGMGAQGIIGPPSAHANGIFIAGPRSGADGGLRRITTGGNTSWSATSCRSPLAADNRVYALQRGTTTSTRQYSGLDAAATLVTASTFNGIGSTYSSAPICQVAWGSTIYSLLAADNGAPRLWAAKGTEPGAEVAVFEGMRVTASETGLQVMAIVNGVVFIGGWSADTGNPMIQLFDGQETDVITRETGALNSADRTITCLAPGKPGELLIGVSIASNFVNEQCELWRYDLAQGSLSCIARRESLATWTGIPDITSAAWFKGRYVMAFNATPAAGSATVHVDATDNIYSTTADRLTDCEFAMPTWDFGYPTVEKILDSVELQTKALPANASVEFGYALDGASPAVTSTDGAGNAVSHATDDAGRTKFFMSDFDSERIFRFMQPGIQLTSSTGSAFPTLYRVVIRALPIPSSIRFFEFDLILRQEDADNRIIGRTRSGDDLAADLYTLFTNTSNRIVKFVPLIKDSPQPHQGPTETEHSVILAPGMERNAHYRSTGPGEGRMRVRFMKVGA